MYIPAYTARVSRGRRRRHLHTRQSRERVVCRLKNEIYHGRRRRHHPENRIPQLMTSDLLKLDGWAGRTDDPMVDGYIIYTTYTISRTFR